MGRAFGWQEGDTRAAFEHNADIRPHLQELWERSRGHVEESGMEKSLKKAPAELPVNKTSTANELPSYEREVTFGDFKQFRSETSSTKSLRPLTRYNFNGTAWVTDQYARPVYAGGELTAEPHGRVGKSLQTKIGNEGDHAATDVGFHLIGDQFGGPISRLNVVQGDALLNNSAYKALENQLKKHVEAGRKVQVRVKAEYSGTARRPTRFRVEYQIENGEFEARVFSNSREVGPN